MSYNVFPAPSGATTSSYAIVARSTGDVSVNLPAGVYTNFFSSNGFTTFGKININGSDITSSNSAIYLSNPVTSVSITGNIGLSSWADTISFTTTVYSLTYGNGLYSAGGIDAWHWRSTDGINWSGTKIVAFSGGSVWSVLNANGLYLAAAATIIYSSTDAITWTNRHTAAVTYTMTYGNGLFLAGGEAITSLASLRTSTDGITWTNRTNNIGNGTIYGIEYGNNVYVAVAALNFSAGGAVSTSTDGATWTTRTLAVNTGIFGLAYGNGIFVAGGEGGRIQTSTDGITWTSRTSNFGNTRIRKIIYGDGLFLAIGQGNTNHVVSTDGITWTTKTNTFGTSDKFAGVYGNGLFIIGGINSTTAVGKTQAAIYQQIWAFNKADSDTLKS
jgi:hypothetical protein